MTGISTFASNRILNFLLGRENLVVPNIFFLALSTTPLGNDGTNITEPTDPAYRRVALPNDKTTFSSASHRGLAIIRDFLWDASTQPWNRCTHFAIFDSNVGGNVWFYGELQSSIDVEIDTAPLLEAHLNEFSLDICGGSTTDMAITTWASNRILDHLLGRSPLLTPPANFFIGVSSTPISTEGIGMTEPSGGGYQRLAIPNDKNSFTFAENKMVTLAKEFRFSNSTTPWGVMTHFFIADALSGGNVWWSGRLVHSRNVELSTTLSVMPNGFQWILDSCTDFVNSSITPAMQSLAGGIRTFWG